MKTMTRWWLAGFVLVAACTKPNPNRCCTDEADCADKGIPVGSLCDDGLVCRGNQCIAQPCTSSDACDSAAPFCIEGLCAEACAADENCPGFGGDSSAPYCVEGACVACRDSADCTAVAAPFCDAGVCRACSAHTECDSELCDFDIGQCIAEVTVVYASPSGSASSSCTKSDPCTLARAAAVVEATRANVKLASGMHAGVDFTRSVAVNVYGPAQVMGLSFTNGSANKARDIEVIDDGISVSRNSSLMPRPSLDVARFSIVRGSLVASSAVLTARNGSVVAASEFENPVTITGTQIVGGSQATLDRVNLAGGFRGVSVGNYSSVVVTNSVIQRMRDNAITFSAGGTASDTQPSKVSFTTFYNVEWTCPDGNIIFESRNNVFLNLAANAPANTLSGTRCNHQYSLVMPQADPPSGANNMLNMDPRFVNAAAGDFHLMAGSPAIDAADPAATEAADFDGVARPQGAGRDLGAFEYRP